MTAFLYQHSDTAARILWHDGGPPVHRSMKMEIRRVHLVTRTAIVALSIGAAWRGVTIQGADRPHVHFLATGGTISGGTQPLDAAGLKALVPALSDVATITVEDVTRI